jgi:hypothetical protein
MPNQSNLPIPVQIENAQRSMELMRVWIADRRQIVEITPSLWDDPRTWGLLLVDIAKHIALAYAQNGHDPEVVRQSVYNAFQMEWNRPTDVPRQAE